MGERALNNGHKAAQHDSQVHAYKLCVLIYERVRCERSTCSSVNNGRQMPQIPGIAVFTPQKSSSRTGIQHVERDIRRVSTTPIIPISCTEYHSVAAACAATNPSQREHPQSPFLRNDDEEAQYTPGSGPCDPTTFSSATGCLIRYGMLLNLSPDSFQSFWVQTTCTQPNMLTIRVTE